MMPRRQGYLRLPPSSLMRLTVSVARGGVRVNMRQAGGSRVREGGLAGDPLEREEDCSGILL